MIQFKTIAAAGLVLAATAAPMPAAAQNATMSVPASAPADLFSGERSQQVLMAQILLDRSPHSPGVVDGYMGGNTRRAITAFQKANGLPVNGKISPELLDRLAQSYGGDLFRTYTISQDDVDGPFRNIPSGFVAQAKLESLAYQDPVELLAEKFHMSQGFLKAMNPGKDLSSAGTTITVVNYGNEKLPSAVARVEVDKSANELRAYAAPFIGRKNGRAFPTACGRLR